MNICHVSSPALSQSNGDLVQRYRELAEVVTVERALRIGRLLERESFRHFDVEGTGLDQAINLFERRILISPLYTCTVMPGRSFCGNSTPFG